MVFAHLRCQESQALWRSVDGASSQALVAGAISEEDAAELVRQARLQFLEGL